MSNPLRLVDVQSGQSAKILALHFSAELQHRFGALGLRCGQEIYVLRHGLMNGPLHVRVGMTEVMVRRSDARQIAIAPMVPLPVAPPLDTAAPVGKAA